eukprot:6208860-Pleurochrysis_carterae.AAC.3
MQRTSESGRRRPFHIAFRRGSSRPPGWLIDFVTPDMAATRTWFVKDTWSATPDCDHRPSKASARHPVITTGIMRA